MADDSAESNRRPAVIDVTERDFEREVIERSRSVPVVVDFWAPWCGPCRMLGPTLERLANEANGAWQLVKVNTDNDPGLSVRYGVQGIPAVKAFRDGQVVAEFVGAQPEPMVRDFLKKIVPSAGEDLVKKARILELGGDMEGAAAGYEEALREQADLAAALIGLGRVRLEQDRLDEAIERLQSVPVGSPKRSEAESLLARARFRKQAGVTGSEMEIRHRVAASPDDMEARLALATVMADKGQYREALEALLTVLERADGESRESARENMLAIFQMIGDGNELTREYRPRMAALLF